MTVTTLAAWIALGLVLQLVIWMALAFSSHLGRYQSLREQVVRAGMPLEPVAPPSVDTGLAAPAWTGFRPFRVIAKSFEDAARSACSFHLAPDDAAPLPDFRPGQFITLRVDVPGGQGATPLVRCYSLSNAPGEGHLRITVKRIDARPGPPATPAGQCSSLLHEHLDVGSVLDVRAPAGHFFLDAGTGPVVLIGAGIGITPMLSMVEWSLAQQPGREIWLFHGVRNSREHVMRARLAELAARHTNLHLQVCYSDPADDDAAGRDFTHRGRIGVALLRQVLPLRPFHYFVCGPSAMMTQLVNELHAWGVSPAHVHSEAFGPASLPRAAHAPDATIAAAPVRDAAAIEVTFARSGRTVAWSSGSGSLLELAEANGIAVNCGCRSGGCGSCQTTIASGEVDYRQTPDFDPEPGSCLLCVCTPRSAVTLEA
jgi:uncharacterized protein